MTDHIWLTMCRNNMEILATLQLLICLIFSLHSYFNDKLHHIVFLCFRLCVVPTDGSHDIPCHRGTLSVMAVIIDMHH